MTDDPRADYRDEDGVLHRWDGDDNYTGAYGGDWYHPAGIRCRDATCPGNRGALERLGGMPPDATEADASEVRAALDRTVREDAYATAYLALYETVRRFLDDGANARYLRRNHTEIDVDLRARLHQTAETTEESR